MAWHSEIGKVRADCMTFYEGRFGVIFMRGISFFGYSIRVEPRKEIFRPLLGMIRISFFCVSIWRPNQMIK